MQVNKQSESLSDYNQDGFISNLSDSLEKTLKGV
jgi:hypothetical protein